MTTVETVEGPASCFPSIEKKYGHPVEHRFGVLRGAGDRKHIALVDLIESGHGLGHGRANALVAYHRARS